MRSTFRSLHVRNYRIWFAGAVVSNVGTWMQRIAQDWLVLQVLTNGSGTATGITTGLQFAPVLLLGPYAGVVADRFDKRRLLMVTQALSGVWGLVLGVLVLSGAVELWHVYALAALLGATSAFDAPARQTFVAEMVPEDHLGNAVGLNSTSFNIARFIGPAVAGALIAVFDTGPVFLLNAVSFAATVVALWRMRVSELRPVQRAVRRRGQTMEGVRYVRDRPDIVMILVVVFVVSTFGLNFQLTTALVATQQFDRGAGQYGLLGSILAVGSVSGALLAAHRGEPRMRMLLGSALAFGVFATASALMPTYWLFAVSLVPVGLSSLTFITAANTTVQMRVDPAMRGRVMALYLTIFMGGKPLGSTLVGWVGDALGPQWTILVGSIPAVLVTLGALAWVLRRESLQVRYRLHGTPHLQVLTPAERRERTTEALAAQETSNRATAA